MTTTPATTSEARRTNPFQLYQRDRAKSADYQFIDRTLREFMFVSGTLVYLHKYIGPPKAGSNNNANGDGGLDDLLAEGVAHSEHTRDVNILDNDDVPEATIGDLLFLENRQRRYADDALELWGQYQIGEFESGLDGFGWHLLDDVIMVTFHTNAMLETVGRKLMVGDVLELPHLLDETGLDPKRGAVPKFYAVEDVVRASEGFDPMWRPHLVRAKAKAMPDSPEFQQLMDRVNAEGRTLRDVVSTFGASLKIAEALHAEAENLAAIAKVDTRRAAEDQRLINALTAPDAASLGSIKDANGADAWNSDSAPDFLAGKVSPAYDGRGEATFKLGSIEAAASYSIDLGSIRPRPVTEADLKNLEGRVRSGTAFPPDAGDGALFLRTDFVPYRLFRKEGRAWMKVADDKPKTRRPLQDKYRNQDPAGPGYFQNDSGENVEVRDSAANVGRNRLKPAASDI